MSKVIIVGGGPAGMLSAIIAARKGNQVDLYEKNDKLGKKLYITGKGRCNITNACDPETFFEHVITNPKFLYSSFYNFNSYDLIDFFESMGLKIKIERGNRVFPISDKSSDVIAALSNELKRLKVIVHLNHTAKELLVKNGAVVGLKFSKDDSIVTADSYIIATGGLSYPVTGSTGDGYRFAEAIGHNIKPCTPSLVPLNIKDDFVKDLQGLSLKNIQIRILSENKVLFQDFGEMIFTHFGVSGPVILSASSYICAEKKQNNLNLMIDLKPALSLEQLDQRLVRDFDEVINRQFHNALDRLLPQKLISVIIKLSEIDPYKKVNLITKEERQHLVHLIKNLPLRIDSVRGYSEAVITKGGIAVNEINPSTMESKKIKHIYFVGEALDLDALTGGYNLQIAWSTAFAAGNAV